MCALTAALPRDKRVREYDFRISTAFRGPVPPEMREERDDCVCGRIVNHPIRAETGSNVRHRVPVAGDGDDVSGLALRIAPLISTAHADRRKGIERRVRVRSA